MRKLLMVCLCCAVWFLSFGIIAETTKSNAEYSMGNNNQTISLGDAEMTGRVFASYDYGYTSVEDLLNVTTLIVRATPIAVEDESDVAVCWVLRVDDSNKETEDIIRLRQIKDEYLLKIGQEVVLALQEDAGEGYYNIPGGGCGLFRIDEETDSMSGLLLESLKEQVPATYSTVAVELTLSDIFDILTDMSNK